MNVPQKINARILLCASMAMAIGGYANLANAVDSKWVSETIADATKAAPPSVTDTASIYGWTSDSKLVLARYGSGSYTCIGSGSFSLRIGKPPLPYADPMCLDHNAWSFIQALWSGKKPLPTEPGLIWMLAGMNVSKSAVDIGAASVTVKDENAGEKKEGVVQMTPHVMILPLPVNEKTSDLATSYSLDHPLAEWIMAVGKPHEHLMVHFNAKDVSAIMIPSN